MKLRGQKILASVMSLLSNLQMTTADTPANCMIEEVFGEWNFKLSNPIETLNCSKHFNPESDTIASSFKITLSPPNIAIDERGLEGYFTMIYNQGFQVFLGMHSYFAFFHWEGSLPYAASDSTYDCHKTMPGWAHNVLGKDNHCFYAEKSQTYLNDLSELNEASFNEIGDIVTMSRPKSRKLSSYSGRAGKMEKILNQPFKVDTELLSRLNLVPKSVKTWEAAPYPNLWNETMTIKQAKSYQGAFTGKFKNSSPRTLKSEPQAAIDDQFPKYKSFNHDKVVPDEFDWRNVNGVNYVSPVRHQDMCGSCYIFSSAAELEARIRIATNNKRQPVLSTQQPVDCSPYSQGCSGGFPFLIAGKWAQDYGFVDEDCYPYEGKDLPCRDPHLKKLLEKDLPEEEFANINFHSSDKTDSLTGKTCFTNRYYTWMYKYVGDYFGNCDAESMKEEIFKHGPIAVGFEVLDDFRYYKSGIYQHTGLRSKVNKIGDGTIGNGFDQTNHAVTIVGYGHCTKENLDYWIVKNSWGEQWGEGGYFKIVRGRDEVGIESMGQGSFVVPPY